VPATLDLKDLNPDQRAAVRRQLGKKRLPGARSFTVDLERRHALRVLALISDLTQEQRGRVLRRALRINAI
jgi:hypothetical protein